MKAAASFGRTAVALLVIAVSACLCLAGDGGVSGIVLLVKQQGEGKAILQPVLPVQFAVEMVARGPEGAIAAEGDVITCKVFRRVRSAVKLDDNTPLLIHELALDCGGRVYVMQGILFSK